jgi:FtsZ-interacting cell division protein ZipA
MILIILGVVALGSMLALRYWLRRRDRKALFVSNTQIRQQAGTYLFQSKKRY